MNRVRKHTLLARPMTDNHTTISLSGAQMSTHPAVSLKVLVGNRRFWNDGADRRNIQ